MNVQVNRRAFLGTAAAGLVIGVVLPARAQSQKSGATAMLATDNAGGEGTFSPNAFVRIAPDDTVTVLIKHIEFGQGPYTGLTTLVAEELDADWGQMRAASAPSDAELYKNFAFCIQGTGGSTAIPNSYEQMRKAGAAAKSMLVAAAADRWGVPVGEISVSKGVVSHEKSGNSARFGELAEDAAKGEVPVDVPLKAAKDFKLIGTNVPKVDSHAKSTGNAIFTMDVMRDGMVVAMVKRPPQFGAKLKSFDAAKAEAMPGTVKVVEVPQGIAVYAKDTWSALKAREAIEAEWDASEAETRSTEQMIAEWTEAAKGRGAEVAKTGDSEKALGEAAVTHEATYTFPFLAHTPMEPLDAVVELREDGAEVWMGSQLQTVEHGAIAQTLGMKPEQVRLNTMLAGGSFGRRAQGDSHFATEAATVAKAHGPGTVKLVWTREDDVQGGYYRPLTVHHIRGGLDADGNVTAWDHVAACQSIMAGTPFEGMMQNGLDPTAFEGAKEPPYTLPNHYMGWARMESPVPVLWWRSVGHTHTAYALETFIDELLEKGGRDAVEGRLALMDEEKHARERGVLQRVAEMAGWSGPKAGDGKARGVAVHKSFDSYVAQIAEVEERDGEPRVTKVWSAVDCGVAVNPNVITAQIEGGVGFGLGAMLYDEITLSEGGRVQQANWDTYRMLRLPEMPDVEVSIIDSDADPTGVGEPGVPPIAPAVGNALRTLRGETPRRLPIVNAGV